ncbi:MAG: GNAT family N-acetyltransferase [Microthrixaceae bacterium]
MSPSLPAAPTLHLGVGGDLAELGELRERLRVDPFDRPDQHPFVPHVTLVQRREPALADAALQLLAGDVGEWAVDSVVLLERVGADRQALWCPIIEEPLGGAVVVGRGGVELHLRSVRILDRRVAALVGLADRVGTAPSRNQLVTSAESPGWGAEHPAGLVGAAVGTAGPDGAALERIVVDTGHRSKGVARQVLSAWILAAGRRGAGVVTARFEETARAGVLESLGFVKLDSATWCRRVGQAR